MCKYKDGEKKMQMKMYLFGDINQSSLTNAALCVYTKSNAPGLLKCCEKW